MNFSRHTEHVSSSLDRKICSLSVYIERIVSWIGNTSARNILFCETLLPWLQLRNVFHESVVEEKLAFVR